MFKQPKRNKLQKIIYNIECRFHSMQRTYYDVRYFIKKILFGGFLKPFYQLVCYDYQSILEFQKFHIEKLCKDIENGMECDEGRLPKIKDMKRVIELLDNIIKDEYPERCGMDYSRSILEFMSRKNSDMYELINTHPNPQSKEETKDIYERAEKLKVAESKELYKILHEKSLGWWD